MCLISRSIGAILATIRSNSCATSDFCDSGAAGAGVVEGERGRAPASGSLNEDTVTSTLLSSNISLSGQWMDDLVEWVSTEKSITGRGSVGSDWSHAI
jgi:hypothetical protein